MKKRIISLLLAFVMLVSMVPAMAFVVNAATAGVGTRKIDGGKRDFRWPVPNNYGLSSCYMDGISNSDPDGRAHYALDIPAVKGTSVVASYPGTVVATYTSCGHNYSKTSTCCGDGFGNYVVLQHSYTRSDGSSIALYSRYSHLTAVSVSKGQSVSAGTQIGTIGSTGYSQGFHLDFQILQNTWTSRATNGLDPYINDLLELPSSVYCASTSSCCGVGPTGCCCYLYIQYVKNQYATPLTCTVTFDANGGICDTKTKSVTTGSTIGTLPTPTRSGYDFAGWYATKDSFDDPINTSTTVSSNVTYYALWANRVYDGTKITFDLQGGMLPDARNTMKVTTINAGRGAGYVVIYNCGGTKVNTNYWGMEIAVDSKGKIVAKRGYNVSEQLTVPDGGFVLSMHADATTFYGEADIGEYIGYYTSNGITYVSHYDSCSAYLENHTYLSDDDEYGCLPLPSRDGYLFHGWFTAVPDSEWGSEVTWDSGYCADTLYAHWVEADDVYPEAVVIDEENNHRYELYDQIMTWTEASSFCESLGGYLVTITSEHEQELIVDNLLADTRRGQYYFGATDEQEEGSWEWVTGEVFGYSNWDKDAPEPSGGDSENYGTIIAKAHTPNKAVGEWNDIPNSNHPYDAFYDICNTGFICEYENACNHSYISTRVDATCVDYGYTTYTCTECGDTYTVYDGDYTEWSTTKPSGVDEDLIETKTQYRYADKETTTSYETSLSGWTQVGGEWKQSGTGSVQYVKSWPSGFLTSHSLYGTYNKSPKSASETNTDKTTINSDKTTGYLYFHWCRGEYEYGPINRTSKDVKDGTHDTFHAFYSTTNPNTLTPAPDNDGSYRYENGSCCKDTYWYYYTPVNTQNYTTYRKLFTYERWGDWSDWSDTIYTSNSSRKVETRTLYRAVEVELGEHDYQNGYCTVCGAEDPDYNFVPVILAVADVSADPGDTVTIPVTISDNVGVAGFTLCIDYNESAMTLTNISKGSLLNTSESGAFTKNVSGKTVNWVDSVNITGDGELMKLTFTIDADAAPGSYDVELRLKNDNPANFVDENSRALHLEFESGIVSVQEPAPAVTLEKIEIATAPAKTVYRIGEALDTTGLTLKATYSDGTTKTITSGYTVSGFDSATAGTKTVTVSYEGKKTTFTVTVKQEEVDPDAPKIIIDSVKATAGETVTVEARLENNPGISSVSMKIDYDMARLKLESAEFGPEISAGAFTNFNLPYITLVRSGDCTGDVLVVTLTFSVLSDAEAGDAYVHLEYEEGDITNYDEEDVNFAVISGCVTVVDYVPGDINGDGKVNSKDLTRLLKYISHEDVEVNEAALDVNGDGKVNSKDLTRLLKYISHEDVEIH